MELDAARVDLSLQGASTDKPPVKRGVVCVDSKIDLVSGVDLACGGTVRLGDEPGASAVRTGRPDLGRRPSRRHSGKVDLLVHPPRQPRHVELFLVRIA